MGLAHGWDVDELMRAPGEVFAGLALPAVDSIPEVDLATGTFDEVDNPDGYSLGYTQEGWTFKTEPTFEEDRVDEEEEAVESFITQNNTTLSAALRQVQNLSRLAKLLPGATYHALTAGIEKVTGGGKKTFDYMTAGFIAEDPHEAGTFWVIVLYRCLNTAGVELGFGRTKNTLMNVTLAAKAVSGRTAGDRVYAIARVKAAGP